MKKGLTFAALILVAAGILVAAVGRVWLIGSSDLARDEAALAKNNLFVFARFNVDQISLLQKIFWGISPNELDDSLLSTFPSERTLLQHLELAGINPGQDIKRLDAAVYIDKDSGLQRAFLFAGNFYPDDLKSYLVKNLNAQVKSQNGLDVYQVQFKNKITCDAESPWFVAATAQWILVAESGVQASLIQRLTQNAPAEFDIHDLQNISWTQLDQGFAVLRVPDKIPEISDKDSPWAEAAHEIFGLVKNFRLAKFSVGLSAMPPGPAFQFEFSDPVQGGDAESVEKEKGDLLANRGQWPEVAPVTTELLTRLNVSQSGSTVKGRAVLSYSAARDFTKIAGELLGLLLVPLPGAQHGEVVEENPPAFFPTISAQDLKFYDDSAAAAEKSESAPGIVGARIDGVSLVEHGSRTGLLLSIRAFTNPVPNVPVPEERVKLFVESVKSTVGGELMQNEDCGREMNQDPVPFNDELKDHLQAEKTLRMTKGTLFNWLGSVVGHAEILLPVATESVPIPRSQSHMTITRKGLMFAVNDITDSGVSYQIWGDPRRILAIQAYNAKHQPLAVESTVQSGFPFFDGGMVGVKTFEGKVESLTVTLSLQDQLMRLPYALNDFTMRNLSSGTGKSEGLHFGTFSTEELERDFAKQIAGKLVWTQPLPPPEGPKNAAATSPRWPADHEEIFEVRLKSFEDTPPLAFQLSLRTPSIPPLYEQVKAGDVVVNKINLADGTAVTGSWTQALQFSNDVGGTAMSAVVAFHTDSQTASNKIKSIEGVIHLRFPRVTASAELTEFGVGKTFKAGPISGHVEGRTRSGVTLWVDKPNDILALEGVDIGGNYLSSLHSSVRINSPEDGEAEISPLGDFKKIILHYSVSSDYHDVPFKLTDK